MKHNVGETIFLKGKIDAVKIRKDGITYGVMTDGWGDGWYVEVEERKLEDCDCILLDDYEREINDLKEYVRQWKDMYYGEHRKVLKLRDKLCAHGIIVSNDVENDVEIGDFVPGKRRMP